MPDQYTTLIALSIVFMVLSCIKIASWLANAYDARHRRFYEQRNDVWWNDPTRQSFNDWKKRNPTPIIRLPKIRWLRMKQNGGSHTDDEWEALKRQYKYKCLCCKQKKPLTKDHVIPVISGGTDNIDNLQPLCQHCNSSKGTKIIDYRLRQKAGQCPYCGVAQTPSNKARHMKTCSQRP